MYIDSLSFTWNLEAAESKTLKQSVVPEVREDFEFCKCLKTWEDLTRVELNVGLFHQRNKHYNLHMKIYTQRAYGAYQGEGLSRWTSS